MSVLRMTIKIKFIYYLLFTAVIAKTEIPSVGIFREIYKKIILT